MLKVCVSVYAWETNSPLKLNTKILNQAIDSGELINFCANENLNCGNKPASTSSRERFIHSFLVYANGNCVDFRQNAFDAIAPSTSTSKPITKSRVIPKRFIYYDINNPGEVSLNEIARLTRR
jgi:hypothetical protein